MSGLTGITKGLEFEGSSREDVDNKILAFCRDIFYPCHLNGFVYKTAVSEVTFEKTRLKAGRSFRCSGFTNSRIPKENRKRIRMSIGCNCPYRFNILYRKESDAVYGVVSATVNEHNHGPIASNSIANQRSIQVKSVSDMVKETKVPRLLAPTHINSMVTPDEALPDGAEAQLKDLRRNVLERLQLEFRELIDVIPDNYLLSSKIEAIRDYITVQKQLFINLKKTGK